MMRCGVLAQREGYAQGADGVKSQQAAQRAIAST